mgnify:CR=1 FL=1
MPTKIAAGNWKMNGTQAEMPQAHLIAEAAAAWAGVTLLCPPATLLARMSVETSGPALKLGGQACHRAPRGAHTGDISAPMLAGAGATYCLAGHSERRTDHGETDADVAAQIEAIWAAGMTAILCIGETLDQREAGRTLDVLRDQLDGSLPPRATAGNTVVAYEPIWAIGTGKVASPAQVAEVHDVLRADLTDRIDGGAEISLLYGGSVKAGNAAELFALSNVDGALVGGASLTAEDFVPIVEALAES